MPDLTDTVLPLIKKNTLPGLETAGDFIYPAYQGYSILNIPDSICHLLGLPGLQDRPLAPEVLNPLGTGVRRVILILVDALAFHRLQRWMGDGTAPVWATLYEDGLLTPLTSVVPSTTSTCLPTIWSGLSPAEHGMVGYELWLKEFGVVANMIKHTPFTIDGRPGTLEQAGFSPETALGPPTLGTHLESHGVKTFACQPYSIAYSGLSRMFMQGVTIRPYGTLPDLWTSLRDLLEQTSKEERTFIWGYWGDLDYAGHNYGPDHERSAAEFANFSITFERDFLNPLRQAARQDTLLLLTADHGQIHTPKDPFYDIKSHPSLARRLHMLPTGENRIMYYFIRPGQTEAVREYLDRSFLKQFVQLDPGYAVAEGLFGPGAPHPHLMDRLGDLITIARGDRYLWWAKKPNPIFGRHGGLSVDEMLVPLLATRI